VTDSRLLSCPIKLPPLDGYNLRQSRSSPAEAESPALSGKKTFRQVLAAAGESATGYARKAGGNEPAEVGRMLESFLLALVFKKAFNSGLGKGVYGNRYESRMYMEMFIDAASEEACRSADLGIAQLVTADINSRLRIMDSEDLSDGPEKLQDMRQSD
jgi:hypothetical protein